MTRSVIVVLFGVPICIGVAMMFDGSRSSVFLGVLGGLICGGSLFLLVTSCLHGIIRREKLGRRMFIGWCLGVVSYGIYLTISGRLPPTGMADTFTYITQTLSLALIIGGFVHVYYRGGF